MAKKVFWVAFTIYLTAQAGFTCTPQPLALGQKHDLAKVMQSDAFAMELKKQIAKSPNVSIVDIKFSEGVSVILSNHCTIKSALKYLPMTQPGLCPIFDRVESISDCGKS